MLKNVNNRCWDGRPFESGWAVIRICPKTSLNPRQVSFVDIKKPTLTSRLIFFSIRTNVFGSWCRIFGVRFSNTTNSLIEQVV